MKKNIHSYERVLRILIGGFMISLCFFGPENLWFMIGVVPLLTGVIGWCPPYQLMGFSTCKYKGLDK